jgi:YidC/Oxa1 family membrane protein insertase
MEKLTKMNWYYGPTDYTLLKSYDVEDIVALGWGIFGWINRHAFIPMYGFLSLFIQHGWAIIFCYSVKLN